MSEIMGSAGVIGLVIGGVIGLMLTIAPLAIWHHCAMLNRHAKVQLQVLQKIEQLLAQQQRNQLAAQQVQYR